MPHTHHVVLIPGFFGFGNLGDLRYFVGVRESLERAFDQAEQDVVVHEVTTVPTGSIRERSARVLETLAAVGNTDDPIHLIGHSTGGLDARLAIAPTASLPVAPELDALHVYERVETLISVSTPHYGTPLADFFGSAMGRPLLRVLAAATVVLLRYGALPTSVALRLGEVLVRVDKQLSQNTTVLEQLYQQLLSEFSDDRRQDVIDYVEAVSSDQSLIFQLTPAGCDLLNASTADPDKVRYGSVITRAAAPSLSNVLGVMKDTYSRSMHLVYAGLHTLAARSAAARLPHIKPSQQEQLCSHASDGELPERTDSDGIVPTLSQVWGEVIDLVEADHLDLIGHFGAGSDDPAHADWLPSGTGFTAEAFDGTWRRVAEFILDEARAHRGPQLRDEGPALQPEEDPLEP